MLTLIIAVYMVKLKKHDPSFVIVTGIFDMVVVMIIAICVYEIAKLIFTCQC